MSTEFASWDQEGESLSICNLNTGNTRIKIPAGYAFDELTRRAYTVSKDGTKIALFGSNRKVFVYDIQSGDRLYEIDLPYTQGTLQSLYLTLSGVLLLQQKDGDIILLNGENKGVYMFPSRITILCVSVSLDEESLFLLTVKLEDDELLWFKLLRGPFSTLGGIDFSIGLGEHDEVNQGPQFVATSCLTPDIVFIVYSDRLEVLKVEVSEIIATVILPVPVQVKSSTVIKVSDRDERLFVSVTGDESNRNNCVYMYTKPELSYEYVFTRLFSDSVSPSDLVSFDIGLYGVELIAVNTEGILNIWDTSSGEKILSTQKTPGKVAFIPRKRWVKPAYIKRGEREEEEEEEEEESTTKRPKHSTCLKCMKQI